ncbi:MAG: alpha/beta hydrolase [Nitrospirota bacterium]|nr:alpha/beta hydrolase [Nitrospirota bacterium]
MANYLLIHGAMRGAWLWDRLMTRLLRGGANPIAVDLPGHGDRSDDRKGLTMTSYIEDVAQFIRRENLYDLVLVGHSMSGFVISKLAEDIPERIRHLVYLAAVVPYDSVALIDLLPKERQDALRFLRGKTKEVFGTIEALRPMYFTDLEGAEQESYLRQLTPEPLEVFFEKIRFKIFPKVTIPRTYIQGLRDKSLPPDMTTPFAERLGVVPHKVDAGHDMMTSRPAEVAEIMLGVLDPQNGDR